MPAVCVNLNITNIHSLYLPGVAIASASNFTVGGMAILRKGDSITIHVHPDPKKIPHIGKKVSAGSAKFSVGGKEVARQGDAISCGGKMMTSFPAFSCG